MKIYIDKDEWYPVHVPVEDTGDSWLSKHYKVIDAPNDIMSRWNNLVTEFNLFQQELKELSKASCPNLPPFAVAPAQSNQNASHSLNPESVPNVLPSPSATGNLHAE